MPNPKATQNKGGPVSHREAAVNRVDESEMQIAEIKSRLNKF